MWDMSDPVNAIQQIFKIIHHLLNREFNPKTTSKPLIPKRLSYLLKLFCDLQDEKSLEIYHISKNFQPVYPIKRASKTYPQSFYQMMRGKGFLYFNVLHRSL